MTRHRSVRLAVPLTLLLALTACASGGLNLKSQVVTGLEANETALTQARVSELALYTAKTIPAYTAEKHLAFTEALLKAQQAEVLAIRAVQAWDATQPTPQIVLTYRATTDNVLAVLQALGANPAASEALQAAQRLVDAAQKLVDSFRKGA